MPNTVARLTVEPASGVVRTGDVVRFAANARDRAGRAVTDLPVEWALAATAGVATIDARRVRGGDPPGCTR